MENQPSIVPRSYDFALRIIKMCALLRQQGTERALVDQLLRSGTSIGANVEEAQGAHSRRDFAAKMRIAYREARETHYWLRLLRDSGEVSAVKSKGVVDECEQITRILSSILQTTRARPPY